MRIRFDSSLAVSLALVVLTLAVFIQGVQFDFTPLDDQEYIQQNINIRYGLSLRSILWSFTAIYSANWHPLTWLSHALDCHLYGLRPGGHHLTSILIHTLSSVLLFVILKKMTKRIWPSACVAILFAIHPLHVESVAWISERKDVLSGLFWILTLGSYARYVENPTRRTYVLTLILFVLGLMSKPMLVSLPLILLLLDYWPFARFRKNQIFRLFIEKIPFFFVAGISCLLTVYAQRETTASLQSSPFYLRFENALISYCLYLVKTFVPIGLSIFYPYPERGFPLWKVVSSASFLAVIFLLFFWQKKKRPHLFVGWLWYFISLIPVIGIVRVGSQAMADRYSYLPLIGIFMAVVWEVSAWLQKKQIPHSVGRSFAILILGILSFLTWRQVGFWKNPLSLFQHAMEVTSDNHQAYYALGTLAAKKGEWDKSEKYFREAIRSKSSFANAYTGLGNVYALMGDYPKALEMYHKSLDQKPNPMAYYDKGVVETKIGSEKDAEEDLFKAIELKPDYYDAYFQLARLYHKFDKPEEVKKAYLKILEFDPKSEDAHYKLGVVYLQEGLADRAEHHFEKALETNPRLVEAHNNLGISLMNLRNRDQAIEHYQKAVALKPDYASAYYNLGNAFVETKDIEKAEAAYLKTLELGGNQSADAHFNLGRLLLLKGQKGKAILHYKEALKIEDKELYKEALRRAEEKK